MAAPRLSDEILTQTAQAYREHGSEPKAAAALGIPRPTFQCRLQTAAQRGFLGTEPVLPGYAIKKTSRQTGPNGELQKQWVQQGPAPGEKFEVPEGHAIKGVSALLDADGRTVQQWVKTASEKQTQDVIAAIKDAFDPMRGAAKLPPAPKHADADLLTVYNLADHHLSMYSWARETGSDYDLVVAEKILLDAMGRLVASAPNAKTAIVLNLGDFFHADSKQNRTEKSGHALDVDTRWPKVLATGVKLMRACIEMALEKHEKVIVRCLAGNHDDHSSIALSVALACFYEGKKRVEVDDDPSKFFFYKHGRVLVSATHGDMVKPDRMAGIVAAMRPDLWGSTIYRVGYQGHVHSINKFASEGGGMVVETFQTLAGKDAWHAASGYCSNRSMTAITHHVDHGEFVRNVISYNEASAGGRS